MPRIDTYLDNLERHGAQALRLTAGQPIQLLIGDQRKMLRKTCTDDEILTLVHEIMDPGDRRTFVVQGAVRFAYRSPTAGPVAVEVERSANQITCAIVRAPGTREEP